MDTIQATYIIGTQVANGIQYHKQILVFGNSNRTTIVNAVYPETQKAKSEEIKKSIFSIIYNDKQNAGPYEAVKFKIDMTGSDFKLARFLSGTLIYTTDGVVPSKKPMIMVGVSFENKNISDQKSYSVQRLKQLPGAQESQIKTINPVTIDGLKGYEITADNKNKEGGQEVIYQTLLFDTTEYYMIIGVATEKYEHYVNQYKTITRTFKRK